MALQRLTENVEIHQTLGDNPNTDGEGMTAQELKKAFDEPARIIKEYINEQIVPHVMIKGDPVTGLSAPQEDTDAATKGYVDQNALPKSGGTMTGAITTSGIYLKKGEDYFDEKPARVPEGKLVFVKAGG